MCLHFCWLSPLPADHTLSTELHTHSIQLHFCWPFLFPAATRNYTHTNTHAHTDVLHRDLSSQNILLTNDGHIKIADFGCARKINERGEYKTTSITGSPAYMAPEQLEGHILTLKCDVWAVVRTHLHTYFLCVTHTYTRTHSLTGDE